MAIYVLIGAIGAIWAAAVASSKNNNAVVAPWLGASSAARCGFGGLLVGVVGVLIAYAVDAKRRAPAYQAFCRR